MADIDIGAAAIDRPTSVAGFTAVGKENPANDSGTITSVEIWADTDMSGCKVATFFVVSGDNLSTRDYETIGSVTSGSKQTFSGLNIDVETGDYLGYYAPTGAIERTNAGSGYWTSPTDRIPCTDISFTSTALRTISLYGEGTTGGQTHQASVTFSGTASLAISAALTLGASVAFAGVCTLSIVGHVTGIIHGSISFEGVATLSIHAVEKHAASIGFAGAATLSIHGGLFHSASIAFAGTATMTIFAGLQLAGSISFYCVGTLAINGTMTLRSAIAFAGIATLTFGGRILGKFKVISITTHYRQVEAITTHNKQAEAITTHYRQIDHKTSSGG